MSFTGKKHTSSEGTACIDFSPKSRWEPDFWSRPRFVLGTEPHRNVPHRQQAGCGA